MFGLIKKYRKELKALATVVSYAATRIIALAKEITIFASSAFEGTSWAF